MKQGRVMYMHTMFGHPAHFSEQDRVVYMSDNRHLPNLRPDLRTIRRDQKVSQATRAGMGYTNEERDYGYIRVEVPK